MKLTKIAMAGVLAALVSAPPAMADLVFPALSYRTGPYAPNGIPFADGYADYLTLIMNATAASTAKRFASLSAKLATTRKRAWNAMNPRKAKAL